MSKIAFSLTLLIAVLICLLRTASAQAQAIRTFVSAGGSDSNPCSITQPCRHFSAAVAVTSAGGEVDALDPGAYGSFTILHAITIEGQGWSYVAPPSNGNAITITANAGDNIKIHGVSLNGVGTTNSNGIMFTAGGSLTVTDCVAQNFISSSSFAVGNGILMMPTSAAISFAITNTKVSNNGSAGIYYIPNGSSTTATGVIDHVAATNNTTYGIAITTSFGGGSTTVAISNSIASNNGSSGISIYSGSAALTVSIDNTSSNSNGDGITANNTPKVTLGRSVITGNTNYGIYNGTFPNTFYSYQDNRINENVADISSPLSSLALH
jgi:hypothetical protein